MTEQRLTDILAAIARVRTLVVGDAMLDEYIWGTAERISPEAPVMVIRWERDTQVPGGAANVVHGLRDMGAAAGLVAVGGNDDAAVTLGEQLREMGVDPVHVVTDPDRPTTVKTRVLAHSQQVVRIDKESRVPVRGELATRLLHTADAAMSGCQGLLLSDYDKGVLTPDTIRALIASARRQGLTTAVNAKPHYADDYRGVDLLTINRVEAEAIAGECPDTPDAGQRMAATLRQRLGCGNVLITLGSQGAALCGADGTTHAVPPIPVQVYDVAGAGDTSIAAAHLALLAGATPLEAVELAMRAAAVVVRKVGVATATPHEILTVHE